MLDPLTIVFMGVSVISVGLNVPLLKNYWRCSCMNSGNGEMTCNSSCKTIENKVKPKLKNVCKDYKEDYSNEHETKAETKTA